jgi:uncharacterized protein YggT (Ycf19 family)
MLVDKAKHLQDSLDEVESREIGRGHAASPEMPADTDTSGVRGASMLVIWVNVICTATAVVVGLIAIRFLLKLLATVPQAGLAGFVYGMTEPVVAPFTALLGNPVGSGSQIEVPSLIAIVVYGLVGALLAREVLLMANGRMAPWRREIT